MTRRPPESPPFPDTTLSRSRVGRRLVGRGLLGGGPRLRGQQVLPVGQHRVRLLADRKSTRLNSSHANISYAVFCLKKKKLINTNLLLMHHPPHHQCSRTPWM